MAETTGISNREMRLRKRNLRKLPEQELVKIQAETMGISKHDMRLRSKKRKKRSEMTEEELEPERRFFEKNHAKYLEECKRIAKEKSQRLIEEEKEPWPPEWKPIKQSIQYKCGMITPFVDDPWGVENMNDDDFKSSPLYEVCGNDDPQVLNKLKAFITQVRNSRAYDVDWVPPRGFCCTVYPIDDVREEMEDSDYNKFVNAMLKCVVKRINARAKKHGEELKPPFNVKKIVEALAHRLCLITFSGTLISDGGVEAVKDVQAMVYLIGGENYDCEEWRFKPEEPGDDAGGPNP